MKKKFHKNTEALPESYTPEMLRKWYWKKQKLSEKPQGFNLNIDGRTGTFFYREGNKVVQMDIEMAGTTRVDLIIFNEKFENWIDIDMLEYEPMSIDDQKRFRNLLIDWLRSEGIRYSLGGIPYTEINAKPIK